VRSHADKVKMSRNRRSLVADNVTRQEYFELFMSHVTFFDYVEYLTKVYRRSNYFLPRYFLLN